MIQHGSLGNSEVDVRDRSNRHIGLAGFEDVGEGRRRAVFKKLP